MLERSRDAAVSFVYLPSPPEDARLHMKYLDALTMITEGLGPVVLVHGIATVTSTTL